MARLILTWLQLAAVVTILIGLVYATVQQNYRQSANDPQIQMAEDAVATLNRGSTPASVVPAATVDQTTSLAPFMIIVNKKAVSDPEATPTDILATNVVRADNGAILEPVADTFRNANDIGEQWFTWETAGGLRFATVIVPYQNGFVLVARSLREVEVREKQDFILAQMAWILSLAVTLFTLLLQMRYVQSENKTV